RAGCRRRGREPATAIDADRQAEGDCERAPAEVFSEIQEVRFALAFRQALAAHLPSGVRGPSNAWRLRRALGNTASDQKGGPIMTTERCSMVGLPALRNCAFSVNGGEVESGSFDISAVGGRAAVCDCASRGLNLTRFRHSTDQDIVTLETATARFARQFFDT